jgi:hypothetical protein
MTENGKKNEEGEKGGKNSKEKGTGNREKYGKYERHTQEKNGSRR